MTATPATGYSFSSWTCSPNSACSTNSISPTTVTIPAGTVNVVANFALQSYSFSATAGTGGTVACSGGGATSCSSANYLYGNTITVTATLAADYLFSSWVCSPSSACSTTSSSPTTVTVPAQSTTVTANFAIAYVPITLANSQGTATASTFQQMITVTSSSYSSYESSGLQNIEFTTGPSGTGTALYAWCESGCTSSSSSTIWWVQLTTAIAASGGTQTVYMNFMPTAVMSSATSYTGEAPQLSGTYGQYDNGASVFTAYWNFAGTTNPPTGWTAASGPTISVSNGVTITLPAGKDWIGIYTNSFSTVGTIVDTYVNPESAGVDVCTSGLALEWSTPIFNFGHGGSCTTSPTTNGNSGGSVAATSAVLSAVLISGNAKIALNYATQSVTDATSLSSASIGIGVSGSDSGHTGGDVAFFQWVRDRVYPPAGVMPSASLGSVA